jgi:hypothetical protein
MVVYVPGMDWAGLPEEETLFGNLDDVRLFGAVT